MKIKYLPLITAFLCCSLISCGSYDSVRDTGILAQSLTDYSTVYNTKPCDIDFAFSETGSSYCDSYKDRDTTRLKALNLLASYGLALEEFVTSTDFSSGDKIGLMLGNADAAGWLSISDAQMQGSTQIANSTYSLINNGIKRSTLKTVIQGNNDAFQKIINSLTADLQLRKQFYATIIKKVEDYMGLDPENDADRREVLNDTEESVGYVKRNRLDNVSVQLLLNRLMQDQALIIPLIDRLKAVGDAHEILAKNYEKIGTGDDAAVAKLIFENLKSIYMGMNDLMPVKE